MAACFWIVHPFKFLGKEGLLAMEPLCAQALCPLDNCTMVRWSCSQPVVASMQTKTPEVYQGLIT
jgi:hypothetical protein